MEIPNVGHAGKDGDADYKPLGPATTEDQAIYDSIAENYNDTRQHDTSAVIPPAPNV